MSYFPTAVERLTGAVTDATGKLDRARDGWSAINRKHSATSSVAFCELAITRQAWKTPFALA